MFNFTATWDTTIPASKFCIADHKPIIPSMLGTSDICLAWTILDIHGWMWWTSAELWKGGYNGGGGCVYDASGWCGLRYWVRGWGNVGSCSGGYCRVFIRKILGRLLSSLLSTASNVGDRKSGTLLLPLDSDNEFLSTTSWQRLDSKAISSGRLHSGRAAVFLSSLFRITAFMVSVSFEAYMFLLSFGLLFLKLRFFSVNHIWHSLQPILKVCCTLDEHIKFVGCWCFYISISTTWQRSDVV